MFQGPKYIGYDAGEERYRGRALSNLTSVKGLGRSWSWQEFVEAGQNQAVLCSMFPETDLPCGCYDG